MKNKSFILFLSLLLFKILLEINYVYFIYPVFSYIKFILDINFIKMLESYLFFIIGFLVLPFDDKKISNSLLFILFIFNFIPLSSYYFLTNNHRIYMYGVFSAYILLALLIYILKFKIKKYEIKVKIRLNYNYILLVLIIIFILYSLKNISKINLEVFLNKNIYEIRRNLKLNGIIGYLTPWFGNIIIPTFILKNFLEKNKIYCLSGIFFQMLFFSMFPFKTFLVIPFFMIANCLLWKRKNFKLKIINLFNLIIIISMVLYYIFDKLVFLSLIVRRVFLVPAQINFIYYDYVQQGGKKLFYSGGQIGRLFNLKFPYEIDFAHYIGKNYFLNEGTSANTGLFADAYVNLGFLGIIVITLFLAIFLLFIDKISENNKAFSFGILVFYINSLTNTSFFTAILTHGLGLAVVLILLNGANNEINK